MSSTPTFKRLTLGCVRYQRAVWGAGLKLPHPSFRLQFCSVLALAYQTAIDRFRGFSDTPASHRLDTRPIIFRQLIFRYRHPILLYKLNETVASYLGLIEFYALSVVRTKDFNAL